MHRHTHGFRFGSRFIVCVWMDWMSVCVCERDQKLLVPSLMFRHRVVGSSLAFVTFLASSIYQSITLYILYTLVSHHTPEEAASSPDDIHPTVFCYCNLN